MELFWKPNEVQIEEADKDKILKSYKLDLLPLKSYFYLVMLGQILYLYNLIVNVNSSFLQFLPTELRFRYYVSVFCFFAIVLQFWAAFMVLVFNSLIVYSSLILTAQFQMLSQRLKIIINEESYKKNELIICINYHDFLIRYVLNKYFERHRYKTVCEILRILGLPKD